MEKHTGGTDVAKSEIGGLLEGARCAQEETREKMLEKAARSRELAKRAIERTHLEDALREFRNHLKSQEGKADAAVFVYPDGIIENSGAIKYLLAWNIQNPHPSGNYTTAEGISIDVSGDVAIFINAGEDKDGGFAVLYLKLRPGKQNILKALSKAYTTPKLQVVGLKNPEPEILT